jgi:AcrR family transcriptional regulator
VRRAEILRRAAAVFRKKGFFGAGMREIAQGLGMAPGALYYYFESKQDLLYACQTLSLKRLIESARRIAAEDAPARVRVARLIRAHLEHVLHELGGSFAHIEFHALPAALLQEVVAKRDAYERILRDAIRRGVEAGEFRPVDVNLAALTLLGALNWTSVWWRPEGPRDLETVSQHMTTTLLEGLLHG